MDQVMTVEQARTYLESKTFVPSPRFEAECVLLADHARLVAEVERLQERIRLLRARQDEVREARGWREPRT